MHARTSGHACKRGHGSLKYIQWHRNEGGGGGGGGAPGTEAPSFLVEPPLPDTGSTVYLPDTIFT